jgi:2-polyprenyl-3-methyl-5-hydroxy-6-metoxy-1,4-benzoquinol methylase
MLNQNLTTINNHNYQGKDLDAMSGVNNYYNWINSMIKNYVGKEILEVGAGNGNFTKALATRFSNSILLSIEPSDQMYTQLSKIPLRTNQTISQSRLDQLNEIELFDTIIYNNVMEHVEDDQQEIKLAYSKLKPGGHLIMFSPAQPFLMSDFDRSIGHYRRYTLKEKVQKTINASFEVKEKYYVDFPGVLAWFIFVKLLKFDISGENAGLYDKIIVPILQIWDPAKLLHFGKNIMVIGRKN